MTTRRLLILGMFLFLVVMVVIPAAEAGTIKGSSHDLSFIMKNLDMAFWDNYADYNQVCVYCHTPHNSLSGEQLLWNRQMPTGPYQLYRSESLISPPNAPGNHSLMCLSCHDGTIAVDSIIRVPLTSPAGRVAMWSNPAYPGYEPMHGRMRPESQGGDPFVDCGISCHGGPNISVMRDLSGGYLTQDLTDDHPVTIQYPDPVQWANRFFPIPSSELWSNGVRLYSGKVECGSCHDVHNPDWVPFLRCNNDESAMCFTCHKK